MSWLANLLIKPVLDWMLEKFRAFLALFMRDRADQTENKTQAAQDTAKAEALKPESSAEEVSEAIDDTLKHF